MAQIEIGNAMPEYAWFEDLFDVGSLKLKTKSGGKAVYEDSNGATIVLTGSGLDYKGTQITDGIVKEVDFLDKDSGELISVTQGHFDAGKLSDTLEKNPSIYNFMTQLTAGNDKIVGNNLGQNLNLGENRGDDLILSGTGGSFMGGSEGNDTMKGGSGWDTLSFEETAFRPDAKHGIKLDASAGTVIDSWGDKDKFSGIEEFRGSIFKDQLTGSKADDVFAGLKGDDNIDGGAGEDEVRYQNDARFGGKHGIVADLAKGIIIDGFGDKDTVSNVERVIGTLSDDKFIGDNHDNQFRGLDGKDSFDGGKGTDAVNFNYFDDIGQHGVVVDLTKAGGQILDDGFGNKETTKSIEAVNGSQFDDKIRLGDGGWAWGDSGDDKITDGTGQQWLGGGDGADTFIFASVKTMNADKDFDYIDDFSQSDGDRIDMSGIKGLSFEGTGDFGGGKEVRYSIDGGHTYIFGDANGDKKTDFAIDLNGEITLTKNDFNL